MDQPFTVEMWINPKPELNAEYPSAILFDKKYVSHNDYQWVLGPADRKAPRVYYGHGYAIDRPEAWSACRCTTATRRSGSRISKSNPTENRVCREPESKNF